MTCEPHPLVRGDPGLLQPAHEGSPEAVCSQALALVLVDAGPGHGAQQGLAGSLRAGVLPLRVRLVPGGEQVALRPSAALLGGRGEIGGDGARRLGQGHGAALSALGREAQSSSAGLDIARAQAQDLADPRAGVGQEAEERPPPWIAPAQVGQHAADLLVRERPEAGPRGPDPLDAGPLAGHEVPLQGPVPRRLEAGDVEVQATTTQEKLDKLYNAIQPLLSNLKKNPEKEYILWPNRIEKVDQFEDHLRKIYNS